MVKTNKTGRKRWVENGSRVRPKTETYESDGVVTVMGQNQKKYFMLHAFLLKNGE